MAGWFALAVALQSAPYLPAGRPCTAQEMADLTALVDFETMADVASARGARVLGTTGQGAWLAT